MFCVHEDFCDLLKPAPNEDVAALPDGLDSRHVDIKDFFFAPRRGR
jgi:hypothetical protein